MIEAGTCLSLLETGRCRSLSVDLVRCVGFRVTWVAAQIGGCRRVDGQMAEHWHVVDLYGLMQQFGAISAPDTTSA